MITKQKTGRIVKKINWNYWRHKSGIHHSIYTVRHRHSKSLHNVRIGDLWRHHGRRTILSLLGDHRRINSRLWRYVVQELPFQFLHRQWLFVCRHYIRLPISACTNQLALNFFQSFCILRQTCIAISPATHFLELNKNHKFDNSDPICYNFFLVWWSVFCKINFITLKHI